MVQSQNPMYRAREIRANVKGTTYPEISKGRFREMLDIMPSSTVMREFSNLVIDIITHVRLFKNQIVKLQQARDILLLRLMSGEITL